MAGHPQNVAQDRVQPAQDAPVLKDAGGTKPFDMLELMARGIPAPFYFVEYPGIILARENTLHDVWGYDHGPYTKGNFDRLRLGSPRFVVELKESECCDEW